MPGFPFPLLLGKLAALKQHSGDTYPIIVQKVKGHTTEEDVRNALITALEREMNDNADKLATRAADAALDEHVDATTYEGKDFPL